MTEGMQAGDSGLVTEVLKEAKISEPIYPWAPAYVAAFQIVQAAFEKAGTLQKDKLMAALKGLKLETEPGPEQFHDSGYGSINTYPSQIQKGKYVVVRPPDVATESSVIARQTI